MTEARGAIELNSAFRLTARADRIDIAEDSTVAIYDYKTGKPPSVKQVDGLFAPQLPLEALIAAEGGFSDLGKRAVSGLFYIHIIGRGEGGKECEAGKTAPEDLASDAQTKLARLIARYADPAMPYEVKRRSGPFRNAYDHDPYEHLARIKEWLTLEAEEEFK
jgi:ATP-dependent helicase/nuclease subunit B